MGKKESQSIPRLNQCHLCGTWHLEKNLRLVEIPDKFKDYVKKPACFNCLYQMGAKSGENLNSE